MVPVHSKGRESLPASHRPTQARGHHQMLFHSLAFAIFFPLVLALYMLLLRRRLLAQNVLLLLASYIFYGWWDWRFLSLIWLSTIIDYCCGLALDRRQAAAETASAAATQTEPAYQYQPRTRKLILTVSLVANLGLLGFFKYCDFFIASFAELLQSVGFHSEPRLLNIILPVGISFYTFQTLSYTIDVYRGQLRAHRSLLEFAVFVAFFPQLVAGPIVRARDFLPQIAKPRRIDLEQIYQGCYAIFWGLFKKIVIADNLANLIVDPVFKDPDTVYGGMVLVAVYAFAFQIYCDFSGYTDIARGCARIMGIDINLNFNLPYFATNPVEFWRRWHISLSSWLRDYLYIPLGGSRRGTRRTCINLMLTMISGRTVARSRVDFRSLGGIPRCVVGYLQVD